MFCQECGSKIPNDSRFCPECRARQVGVAPPQINRSMQKFAMHPEEAAKLKKRNRIIAAIVIGALVLCLVIGLASVFIKPTINLNNYLAVSFEGYDTVGKAVVTFDKDGFESEYEKKLGKRTGEKLSVFDILDLNDFFPASDSFLYSCVDGSLDIDNGLSNGDIVTYRWDCNDELVLERYGLKLEYNDVEYTVLGLEEAEIFNPFDGIEVVFEGISPRGTASVSGECSALAARDLRYELDVNYGLSNGEKVTMTASALYYNDPVEYCIENYGMIPSPLTKEYVVEGLDRYVSSVSDISNECIKVMQAQAEDVYKADVAQDWDEDETLKSFTCIGSYLLTNKDGESDWGKNNIFYLVYKAQVEEEYTNEEEAYRETIDIYWYICFYDLLVNSDGVVMADVENYGTPNDGFKIDSGISSGWWDTKSWYHYGYHTLDELYEAVVTTNSEFYNHQDNVDESIPVAEVKEESLGENGVILPNSSEELLDESVAKELSDEDLRYAINELYARHGYVFKDDTLSAYYEQFDWYEQKVEPDDFSMELFNEVEKANVEMLQKERDSREQL